MPLAPPFSAPPHLLAPPSLRVQLLALMGGQFKNGDEICGVVLSIRYQEDLLSLWNKSADSRRVCMQIRDTLRLVREKNESVGRAGDTHKRGCAIGEKNTIPLHACHPPTCAPAHRSRRSRAAALDPAACRRAHIPTDHEKSPTPPTRADTHNQSSIHGCYHAAHLHIIQWPCVAVRLSVRG
jgi:hypothetical protein